MEDVTEQHALEGQLRQTDRLESVGRLAGGVAHDFNNLLTGIKGFTQLAHDALPEGSPARADLEEVRQLSDRAASLTRQLLAFSRKQALEVAVFNINELVENCTKMLGRLIGEDIALEFLPADDLGSVEADPGQIEQILMNLAVNARDAMPTGGQITIETANVSLDEEYAKRHVGVNPGQYVMLAVTDTGCGMDPATQDQIFEPFFTTKEVDKGTGLGLATVYGIVKQHGGNIWVYSEIGEGTTFKVYLPRVDADDRGLATEAEPAAALGGAETILFVEDEKAVREVALRTLGAYGYHVLIAACAEEAEALFATRGAEIDLLVTDVVMPGKSGRELYSALAVERPSLMVIYTSGYTANAIVHLGVLEEGTQFIQKPYSPEALARKIRETLDTRMSS